VKGKRPDRPDDTPTGPTSAVPVIKKKPKGDEGYGGAEPEPQPALKASCNRKQNSKRRLPLRRSPLCIARASTRDYVWRKADTPVRRLTMKICIGWLMASAMRGALAVGSSWLACTNESAH
jgi:hypothetical protein